MAQHLSHKNKVYILVEMKLEPKIEDKQDVSKTKVTRARAIEAAVALFAEKGYRATSMKDIAATVGIQAPSLYNHVRSKQEILFEIMDSAMNRALADCREAVSDTDDVAEQLRSATGSLVLQFLLYSLEVTVSNNEIQSLTEPNRAKILAKRDEYGRVFRNLIERGCSLGIFHVESPRLASYAILEMGNSAKAWFRKDGLYSEAEVARQYSQFALRIVGVFEAEFPYVFKS